MAIETFPRSSQRSWLDQTVSLSRINVEVVAYVVIVALSVIAHLWGLGAMAMHHDEGIHAWTSWRFYTGSGTFSCANGGTSATYCYDPVYHGPSLYILTFLSYFLFGDGDAQARLPMALAGIGLVASSWMLRPYLGRRGALIAAVLLGFSPSLLYFTRFARHDALMLLWELWMVIGFFRYVDTGRSSYLYLLAAAIALAIGTHELYYILFFIFGVFLLVRLVAEAGFQRLLNISFPIALGVCLLLMIFNRPLPIGQGLYLGEKAFLVGSTLLLAWLSLRVWDPQPLILPRFRQLWYEERTTLWIALAILGGIYLVLYTTFFAYPPGALDGLYAGLAYWLGSQHEYARGDQPWYYYIMQLPLYEPLGVISGIGAAIYLFTRRHGVLANQQAVANNQISGDGTSDEVVEKTSKRQRWVSPSLTGTQSLFALLLVCWYFSAIVIFSWAGEKMPWLLVHMSLPGNLVAAWVLGRALRVLDKRVGASYLTWAIPPVLFLTLIAFGVAAWRLSAEARGQEAQINLLQAILALFMAGGLLFVLLTIGLYAKTRLTLAVVALTLSGILGVYMIRATWLAVYRHPDTPVELLVYTQTSPDVPRYVADVREIAINLTRNNRSAEDITGGLSMPIIIDSGNSEGGEGSLAWPLQWYLRDFQQVRWQHGNEIRDDPTLEKLEVQLPDGSTVLAPVVMLSRSHMNEDVRSMLREAYVQPYGEGGVFNWWFPEGDKCSPQNAGYKKFYYNSWTPSEGYLNESPGGCGRDISADLHAPWAAFTWPFNPANWETLWNFALYRQLPDPLRIDGREMEVWLRRDVVSGASESVPTTGGSANNGALVRLVADQSIGELGELINPTGMAVDRQGNVYVADTLEHRIQVFDADGMLVRSIGSFGSGENQFYEPRGIAIDRQGNLYVTDTWNARVVKLSPDGEWVTSWGSSGEEFDGRRFTDTGGTQEGNAASPLGFYGPRGIAVDTNGHVYIADTGNKRIVVTDNQGRYLYQLGYAGAEPGAFNEPTGVGVDRSGNLYVADTWNSRVQVFAPGENDQVGSVPIATWRVSGWNPNTYEDPSIAVSPDGDVYVSVPLQDRMVAANLRGDMLLRWGGPGQDLASLDSPSGVAVGPDGAVYVVDRNNKRILRFVLPQIQPE